MSGEITSNEIRTVISEEIVEVLRKEISSFGTGAHVVCPKEHKGKIAYIVVCRE